METQDNTSESDYKWSDDNDNDDDQITTTNKISPEVRYTKKLSIKDTNTTINKDTNTTINKENDITMITNKKESFQKNLQDNHNQSFEEPKHTQGGQSFKEPEYTQDSQNFKEPEYTQDSQNFKEPEYTQDSQNFESYIQSFEKSIQKFEQTILYLVDNLKTFTDTNYNTTSKEYIYPKKHRNYYDISSTIETAGSTDPNDFDSPVYNVERIFEVLERHSEIIHVINGGRDNLFVVVSHRGGTSFSQEAVILPGEVKQYYNVYELRLRSSTVGHPYRITEYPITDVSQALFIPIEVASIHNEPLPAANTNWLPIDITPLRMPTTFRIEITVSVAGTFSAIITNGGNTQIVNFNVVAGPALIPGGQYIFELLLHEGDTVNFIYSVTGGTIQILRIQEIDSALA